MTNFKTTIGLEIHVQLKTLSKMFCRCNNEAFGKEPNKTICPICLGMPGMLPVTNKQAVEWTIKTGLALDCEINKLSKFDRKHYFYPDLPKGYQISQYDMPLCKGGHLDIQSISFDRHPEQSEGSQSDLDSSASPQNDRKKIRLNRIHLEEDAGKLIHKDGSSLVDLNRAGTPLMEIVTEPDIESPAEAAEFLRKLQKIVRDVVKVSEASMEKGHLRCDANIDVKDENGKMSPIVEIKNLNSFKFVQKALEFEVKRLSEDYANWPDKRSKITRGFNSQTGETYEQRTKEEAADYRYFPEPDLPPIDTAKFDLDLLKSDSSDSEDEKISSLVAFGIPENDAKVLANNHTKYDIFSKLSAFDVKKDILSKIIVHNLFGFEFTENDFTRAEDYALLIKMFTDNKINKNIFQQKSMAVHNGESIKNINLEQVSNEDIQKIVDDIIVKNPKDIERYKNGETQLLGYFVGQIMKQTSGKADPKAINQMLKNRLEQNVN